MARHSSGALSAGAGSTTLPLLSLYSIASRVARLREVGIFQTVGTVQALKLIRLGSAGTQGTGLVEADHNADSAADATAFNTHTVNPTLGDDLGYRTVLPATIGAGLIWTFGDEGIIIPAGTANGVGIIVENGTGQVIQGYFVWDE